MSMYKSRAFSKRRLYSEKLDSLHLKKTPACLVVLFLSDLYISYFLFSVYIIVLCLSRFFFFYLMCLPCFVFLCFVVLRMSFIPHFGFTLLPTVCLTFSSLVFFAKPRSTCHILMISGNSSSAHHYISFSSIFDISVKNKSLSLHDLAVKATIG